MIRELTTVGLSMILFVACKTATDLSEVKIVGGKKLSTSKYPWIVLIGKPIQPKGHCTASFVGPSVAITAAHCVDGETSVNLPEFGDIESESILQYPPRPHFGVEDSHDLALIVFKGDVPNSFATLKFEKPKSKDPVTLVGYGSCTEFLGPKVTFGRCIGKNKIDKIESDGSIVTLASKGASVTKGDSGGPLFVGDNSIIGIANKGSAERSYHTGLSQALNIEWLKDTIKRNGLSVCGVSRDNCNSSLSVGSIEEIKRKGNKLARELVEKLSSESSNCSFKTSGEVEVVETDRIRVPVTGKLNQGNSIDVVFNIGVLEYDHGSETYDKIKASGRLKDFLGCIF